jgi:hypothetical protein
VEGLIRKESLGDRVEFDEMHMSLTSRRSGQTLTLGDPVQVEIADVSVVRRRVELKLLAVKRSTTPQRPRGHDIATADDYTDDSRVGLARKRRAGRAVAEATIGARPERRRAAAAAGRPKLKVSHRRGDDDGGGGRRSAGGDGWKKGGKASGKGGGKGRKR